jgi:hypothetical protein
MGKTIEQVEQVYRPKQSIRQLLKEHDDSPDKELRLILQNQWSLKTKPEYKGSAVQVARFFMPLKDLQYHDPEAYNPDKSTVLGLEVITEFDYGDGKVFKDKDGFFTSIDGIMIGQYSFKPLYYKMDIKAWKVVLKLRTDVCDIGGLRFGMDYLEENCFRDSCLSWADCGHYHDIKLSRLIEEFPPENITGVYPG